MRHSTETSIRLLGVCAIALVVGLFVFAVSRCWREEPPVPAVEIAEPAEAPPPEPVAPVETAAAEPAPVASASYPDDAAVFRWCDPREVPFFPCCDRGSAVSWTEKRPPTSFDHGALWLLSCAPTAHLEGRGPAWLCGWRPKHCEEAKLRAGECRDCAVYLAGPGQPAIWTGHRFNEVDGPWSQDGKTPIWP